MVDKMFSGGLLVRRGCMLWGSSAMAGGSQILLAFVPPHASSCSSSSHPHAHPLLPSPHSSLPQAVSSGYHPVLALKNARVGDFNGKTLSTGVAACVAAGAVMFTLLE